MAGASETIVKLRTEKGWSQQELADRLLVSRSLVSMWELGSRKPDRFSVERMAALFGVSAEDIISDNSFAYYSREELESIEKEIEEMTESDPNENETNEYRAAVINSFISQLSRKNRIIFTSRYMLMKTCRAIGNDLDMSEASVRARLMRLRNGLKDFYRETKNDKERFQ